MAQLFRVRARTGSGPDSSADAQLTRTRAVVAFLPLDDPVKQTVHQRGSQNPSPSPACQGWFDAHKPTTRPALWVLGEYFPGEIRGLGHLSRTSYSALSCICSDPVVTRKLSVSYPSSQHRRRQRRPSNPSLDSALEARGRLSGPVTTARFIFVHNTTSPQAWLSNPRFRSIGGTPPGHRLSLIAEPADLRESSVGRSP